MAIKADSHYLNILLDPIKVCLDYRPKFGTSDSEGVSFNEFVKLLFVAHAHQRGSEGRA